MTADEYLHKLTESKMDLAVNFKKLINNFLKSIVIDTSEGHKVCSHEINYFVNEADFTIGPRLSVSMFSYECTIPVYSDPPTFDIALANPNGFGYIPYPGWEETLDYFNINPDMVKKIRLYLSSKPPVDY